ncbi:MAG: high-affinity branched-chain amino acid ABC transporter permease LivM [Burkholderiales bacterium]|jgi:branched-chain amino acid transport system permease protein|nr:high-affinity branched-chain amino acid ABC transporter permease LivM [Burkholderiales bacterium]
MRDTTKSKILKDAFIAAAVTAVLTFSMVGMRLKVESTGLTLHKDFMWPIIAVLVVFLARLVLPFVLVPKASVPTAWSQKAVDYKKWWLGAFVVLALVWPFTPLGSGAMLTVMTMSMIYILLALGLNIIVGYAGLLNLGHAAFYAIGAYTYALLNVNFGFGFWEALPFAGLTAALFGILLGFPVLRLRGDYLAIVTLGFGEIVRIMLNNWDSVTHGPDGINNISKPTVLGYEITRRARTEGGTTLWQALGIDYSNVYQQLVLYFIAFLLVVAAAFLINRLVRMPIGRAWEALREDEIACRSLALNPTMIKLTAFSLGSMFAGFAGAFYAAFLGSVTPGSFEFIESAIILSIVVLGGMGSQRGVILAALALTLLPEFARGFAEYRMLIFGAVMVLMMLWRPQGLWPASRRRVELPS